MGNKGSGYAAGRCGKNTRERIALALYQKTALLFKQPKRGSAILECRNPGQEMKHENATAVGCCREAGCSCRAKFRQKDFLLSHGYSLGS